MKVKPLAARQNRLRQLVYLGGRENEDHMLGRLLQRFEKRVERLGGEHMHLVDDIDAEARAVRLELHLVDDVADVLDFAVGRRVHLHHVEHAAVFDAAAPLDNDDLEILSLIRDKKSLVILNKTDKADIIEMPEGFKTVKISAKEGTGANELVAAIEEIAGVADLDASSAVILNERQRDLADKALACVSEAKALLLGGYTVDAVSVCVDDALSYLYTFLGKRVTNEVADEVFRRFCVGK